MRVPLGIFGLILAFDYHFINALYIVNLSVPPIIDYRAKAKLSCSYELGMRELNSVKWYKDGQEFFRYSPKTPPTYNTFPVQGITISSGSYFCNQFMCNAEIDGLSQLSSGTYKCEVSEDAPEFKLIAQTANMTIGVLPKGPQLGPYLSGINSTYRYKDTLKANCSSEWSNPPASLSWYINSEKALPENLSPQQEVTRNLNGFIEYKSVLQIRLHMDNPQNLYNTRKLEMKCIADIFNDKILSRQKVVKTTVLSKLDDGYNQRLIDSGKSTSTKCTGPNQLFKHFLPIAFGWMYCIYR